MTKEKKVYLHLVEKDLGDSLDLLYLLDQVKLYKCDSVILMDVFPKEYSSDKKDSVKRVIQRDLRSILQSRSLGEIRVADLSIKEMKAVPTGIKNHAKKIMFVVPKTIHHWLFYQAFLEEFDGPYFDEHGWFAADARWVLEDTSSFSYFDSIFRKAIGYAQPFPDAHGDGRNFVEEFIRIEKKHRKIEKNLFMIEDRVRNSINLVNHSYRTIYYPKTERDDFRKITTVLTINALGMGEYHTNTLVEVAKEKFGELSYIFILRRGKDGKEEVVGLGEYLAGFWEWAAKEPYSNSYMLLRFKDYQTQVQGSGCGSRWKDFVFAR